MHGILAVVVTLTFVFLPLLLCTFGSFWGIGKLFELALIHSKEATKTGQLDDYGPNQTLTLPLQLLGSFGRSSLYILSYFWKQGRGSSYDEASCDRQCTMWRKTGPWDHGFSESSSACNTQAKSNCLLPT